MVEDIKMNAFQEVEDYEYIYVELADGSQAKIKKSVLANLIRTEIKESFLQNNTEIIDDCNSLGTYENNGLYWINEDTKNAPPLTDYKLAFLFKLTSPGFYYQLWSNHILTTVGIDGSVIIGVTGRKYKLPIVLFG